jgi:hypothetical protein
VVWGHWVYDSPGKSATASFFEGRLPLRWRWRLRREGRGYGPYHELTYDTYSVKLLGRGLCDSDANDRSSNQSSEYASGDVLDGVPFRRSTASDRGIADGPIDATSSSSAEALVGIVPPGYASRVGEYHRWVVRSRKRFWLFTPVLAVLCYGCISVGFHLPLDSVGGIVGRLVGVVGGLMFIRRVYCEFEF